MMSKEVFVRNKPHVNMGVIITVFGLISGLSLGMLINEDIQARKDNDGDTVPDLEEAKAARSLFFMATESNLTFSTYETRNGSNVANHELGHNLELSHDNAEDPNPLLEIRSEIYEDISSGSPNLELTIKFAALIEFIDVDGDGFFKETNDAILTQTDLTDTSRSGFGYGVDGEPAYFSSYKNLNGKLLANFYTTREHVLLGRQVGLLSPNEQKSEFNLVNYDLATIGTNLALKILLISNTNLNFTSTNSSVHVTSGEYEMSYEWRESALIDGNYVTLNTTIIPSPHPSNTAEILINFGEMQNLTLSPTLSWIYPVTLEFNFSTLPWSYIAIGSIFLLTGTAATKIPRKKPGRVIYTPITIKNNSNTKNQDTKKRIPHTLRHRNR
jgi:hypothetical protein